RGGKVDWESHPDFTQKRKLQPAGASHLPRRTRVRYHLRELGEPHFRAVICSWRSVARSITSSNHSSIRHHCSLTRRITFSSSSLFTGCGVSADVIRSGSMDGVAALLQ